MCEEREKCRTHSPSLYSTLTLLENWDKALARIPNSIRLWSDYINLRQTNFSSFSFDDCVKVFEDCLGTLHQISRRLQTTMKHDDDHLDGKKAELAGPDLSQTQCTYLFLSRAGKHRITDGLCGATLMPLHETSR
jgi:hypothetical protein